MSDDQNVAGVGPFMCGLFEKQLYTDVTFFSENGKASVSAHRAVMAAKSDFFANLLFGDKKNDVSGMQMTVKISNVPFYIFTDILKYFYTDDIEFTDDRTVLDIYAATQSFQIHHLSDKCKIYIESIELREDNVCSLLQVCNGKQIGELKNRCINYIKKNTLKVIRSTDFEKCSFVTVREICDLQSLSLTSEGDLLEAVLRWVNFQPKHMKKELMKSFLTCIRFLSFTPRDLSDIVQKHSGLLTPEEALNILMYLSNPTPEFLKKLPKWCSQNPRVFQTDHKEMRKDVFQKCSEDRKVRISLKPTSDEQDITELTSIVSLRCLNGRHCIKSIKFSFEDTRNDATWLAFILISMHVSPIGFTFRKNYTVKSKECTYSFSKPVIFYTGQTLQIEVAAKINHTCRFLQFERWHRDPKGKDFHISVACKPKSGKLNFISEVVYEKCEEDAF